MLNLRIVLFLLFLNKIESAHFRGGTISWVPVDPYCTSASCQVSITTRFYYIYGRFSCSSPSQIGTTSQLGDGLSIKSLNGPAWSISANVYCTGFSIADQWQKGSRVQTATVISSYAVTARFTAW